MDPRNLRINHPSTVRLPEPINVSPLIRTARWVALGLGIVWGAWRLHRLSYYHADIREWQFEKALKEAEEKAAKKKILTQEEMRYLFKMTGLSLEDGIAQLGVEKEFLPD